MLWGEMGVHQFVAKVPRMRVTVTVRVARINTGGTTFEHSSCITLTKCGILYVLFIFLLLAVCFCSLY
ncbi:hypothetical protein BDZ91DRAFT_716643 [Kalaharituber pfeilii]|nr:hypothetical protein BDZ91DRAFT_716643 [Kalaharituber pfeilii]